MKKIVICLFASIFLFNPLLSQTNEELKKPSNNICAFLAKKGSVLIKNYSIIGTFKSSDGGTIEFNEIVTFEPEKESESVRGLAIEVNKNSDNKKTNCSFLDIDEIDAFVKAVYYIYTTSMSWKEYTKDYTEVSYSTKDNFKIGFYQKGTKQTFFATVGDISKTNYLLSVDDFVAFIQIAGKSKSVFFQK